MAIQTISTAYNPVSGVFGTGQVQLFTESGTWNVPPGIGKVRARVWGGGGGSSAGGAGGGFSLRAIYDLTGVTSVAFTVGGGGSASAGGTSSFGSYCSATGGGNASNPGGTGTGGDINNTGGTGGTNTGGGAASIFGRGGGFSPIGASGGAGQGTTNTIIPAGAGFMGSGGLAGATFVQLPTPPTSGLQQFSIDFIGTGGGGGAHQNGINGSGAGVSTTSQPNGGIPGGGSGTSGVGGNGLVIVEW